MGDLRLRRLSGLPKVLASKFWTYDLNLGLSDFKAFAFNQWHTTLELGLKWPEWLL